MPWRAHSPTWGWRMRAAQLRTEIVGDSVALAWDQWSQLGVSAASPPHREERAADPEALLLFTLEVGRNDPRLFDEVLDWLALNEHLVSVHRLRNVCVDATDSALVGAALDWSARSRGRERSLGDGVSTADLVPLFHSVPMPLDNLDESFARHGFARARVTPSGKSQPPRLGDPISFALRMRRLLGVGVRAEVIRALLTIRATRLSGKVITASAAFAQRNVREGLTQLLEAGVINVVDIADDRYYSVRHADWATLLGLPAAPDLPLHFDWIPAYRTLMRSSAGSSSPTLTISRNTSGPARLELSLTTSRLTWATPGSRSALTWPWASISGRSSPRSSEHSYDKPRARRRQRQHLCVAPERRLVRLRCADDALRGIPAGAARARTDSRPSGLATARPAPRSRRGDRDRRQCGRCLRTRQ